MRFQEAIKLLSERVGGDPLSRRDRKWTHLDGECCLGVHRMGGDGTSSRESCDREGRLGRVGQAS